MSIGSRTFGTKKRAGHHKAPDPCFTPALTDRYSATVNRRSSVNSAEPSLSVTLISSR